MPSYSLNRLCRFTIPRLTLSNNELLRMHFIVRKDLNATWWWEIKAAINKFEHNRTEISRSTGPVKRGVLIVSYRKKKLDDDNFFGGLKPLLDSLVAHKLIWDDNPEVLELRAEIQIDTKDQRTVVEISL